MWSLWSSGPASSLAGLPGTLSSLSPSPPPASSPLAPLLPQSQQRPPNWPLSVHSCPRTQQFFENRKCNRVIPLLLPTLPRPPIMLRIRSKLLSWLMEPCLPLQPHLPLSPHSILVSFRSLKEPISLSTVHTISPVPMECRRNYPVFGG